MSQGFTSGYPATCAGAVSATERANWAATLSSHSGATIPGYAVAGMPFFDTGLNHLCVAKSYGSKAYGNYAMGAQINLAFALTGAGQDGSTYSSLVRVRTNAVMSSVDHSWALVSTALTVDFNIAFTPAYFVGKDWANAAIGEPVLYTSDGKLLGKNWETIPTGPTENVYSGSPSPLSNVSPFAATLRGVDLEDRTIELDAGTPPTSTRDHVVMSTSWAWWNVQDAKLTFDLIEDGRHRHAASFKAVAFITGGVVKVVVYNRDESTQALLPFDPTLTRTLVVTRKV